MRPYHTFPQSLADPLSSDAVWLGQDSTHYYAQCSYAGPLYKSTVACLDSTTGAKLHDVVDVEGIPNVIISDGSGGVYVAGRLTHINGVNTPGQSIVHIHSDGTLDGTFSLRFSGSMGQYFTEPFVTSMALLSGTLYIGGYGLCTLNGTYLTGTSLCAVNATTGAKVAWDPFTSPVTYSAGTGDISIYADPTVNYLVTDGTSIFASGNFVVVSNAITHIGFVKIHPTTAVIDDTWVPSAGLQRQMAYLGSGLLVVANTTSVNTVDATTGATGGALISGINGGITSMVTDPPNTKVYVTGEFTVSLTKKLAASSGWSIVIPNLTSSLAVDPGGTNLYLGNVKYLAADGSVVGAWTAAANVGWTASVKDASAFWGCASSLTTVAKSDRHALAQINKSDGTLTSWNPNVVAKGTSTFIGFGGFDVVEGTLYAAGGATNQNLYAIDTSTGTFTNYIASIVPEFFGDVIGFVTAAGSDVYIGSNFTTVNGQARTRLAKFTSGVLSAWVPTTPVTVNIEALKVSPDGSKLFYGYNHGVVCLDTATGNTLWTVATALTGFVNGDVSAFGFSPDQTKLYVGGNFDTVHGTAGHVGMARLNSTTGALDSWNPNVFSVSTFVTPFAIETVGDYVYWAGWFVLGANGLLRNGAMCVKASDASWTSTWDPVHTGGDSGWLYSIIADAATGRLLTSSTNAATLNKRRASALQFHSGTPDAPGGPDLTTPITPGAIAQTKTFASSGNISSFTVTLDQPLSRGGSLFLFLAFSTQNVRLPAISFEAGSAQVFADQGDFGPQANDSGVVWKKTSPNPGLLTYQTAIWFAAGDNGDDGDQEIDAPPQILTIKWDTACSVACAMVEVAGLNTDTYDSGFGVMKMSNTDSPTVTSGLVSLTPNQANQACIWGIATSGATVYSGLTSTHMTYTVGPQIASTGGSGDVAIQVLYDTTTTLASGNLIDFSANIAPSRKYVAWFWGVDLISTGNAV